MYTTYQYDIKLSRLLHTSLKYAGWGGGGGGGGAVERSVCNEHKILDRRCKNLN